MEFDDFSATKAHADAGRAQLLTAGRLRVGINTGNRLTRLVGREIATDLATHLGCTAAFVDYPTPGALGAVVGKEWDVAFIAADADREASIAFSPPYMEIDATYLVPVDSPIRSLGDIDRTGVRIGTGATSAYTLVLKRQLQNAEIVLLSRDGALGALAGGTVEAVAGLRFDLDAWATADATMRVLPETFARAQQAIAVPRANIAALACVTAFLVEQKRSGAIGAAIRRTGLSGASAVP